MGILDNVLDNSDYQYGNTAESQYNLLATSNQVVSEAMSSMLYHPMVQGYVHDLMKSEYYRLSLIHI